MAVFAEVRIEKRAQHLCERMLDHAFPHFGEVLTPLRSVRAGWLRIIEDCRYRGPSGTLLAFLPRKGHPSPSWLQMVVSSFSCSGIPTGDLNPIYNVPMLGTHKTLVATGDNVPLEFGLPFRRCHS